MGGHDFSSRFPLPLSGGAELSFIRLGSFGYEIDYIAVPHAMSAGVRVSGSHSDAAKLYRGDNIADGKFVECYCQVYILTDSGKGNFSQLGEGFAGFKFDVGNGFQYVWARISPVRTCNYNALVVLGYAWGDPGDQIRAGQTRSPRHADAVPVSDSLGLLALGSTGLNTWREQRTACSP